MVIISIVCEISVYCSLFVRIFNKIESRLLVWCSGVVESLNFVRDAAPAFNVGIK